MKAHTVAQIEPDRQRINLLPFLSQQRQHRIGCVVDGHEGFENLVLQIEILHLIGLQTDQAFPPRAKRR